MVRQPRQAPPPLPQQPQALPHVHAAVLNRRPTRVRPLLPGETPAGQPNNMVQQLARAILAEDYEQQLHLLIRCEQQLNAALGTPQAYRAQLGLCLDVAQHLYETVRFSLRWEPVN